MSSLYVPFGGNSCTVHTTSFKFHLFTLWDFCGKNDRLKWPWAVVNKSGIKLFLSPWQVPAEATTLHVAAKVWQNANRCTHGMTSLLYCMLSTICVIYLVLLLHCTSLVTCFWSILCLFRPALTSFKVEHSFSMLSLIQTNCIWWRGRGLHFRKDWKFLSLQECRPMAIDTVIDLVFWSCLVYK